jgi:hypothetical protein
MPERRITPLDRTAGSPDDSSGTTVPHLSAIGGGSSGAGDVPTAIAVGLPVTWLAAIPLATLGGGVISGAHHLARACLLANDTGKQTASPVAQPANAPPPEDDRSRDGPRQPVGGAPLSLSSAQYVAVTIARRAW